MNVGSSATSLRSVQDARKELQQFLKTLDTVPDEVIDDEIPKVRTEAIAQTPYRDGKLEASVYVKKSINTRDRVGFVAGASAKSSRGYNYAAIQHENTAYEHTKGKAFYISDPYRAGVARIIKRMNALISKAKPGG